MQPAFIASWIADPVAWDPHTLMPGGDLNECAVAKLVNYLESRSAEEDVDEVIASVLFSAALVVAPASGSETPSTARSSTQVIGPSATA
ncbi:MAG: hypothetical protein U5K56_18090 [Halioglobus sp.]|nr:hypothetical protein [Halioglobus sp.]